MPEKNFEVKDGLLYIGGVSVKKLKEKYKTPLYIYDQKLLKDTVKLFIDKFKSEMFETEIVYASKSFSNLYVLGLMNSLKTHLDVVSIGELYSAIKAGFNTKNIHFHGNNKLYEELEYAIKNNVGSIIIDNPSEYERISEISKKENKKVNVLLRINPQINTDTHKYIQTSNADSKFGMHVLLDETNILIKKLIEDENINFEGFHAHIGSQVSKGEFYFEEADILLNYLKSVEEKYNYKFTKVNFGGGFGVEQKKNDKYLNLETFLTDFIKYIENKIKELNLNIKSVAIEPGRSISNQSGNMLYTVGYVKETLEGLPIIFVDGGMSDNIRPALYDAKYDAFLANKMNEENTEHFRVAGKLCESGDILIKDTKLPKVKINDLLLIPSTGSYTFSMHSRYNRIQRPAVVFVEDSKDYLAVKRESLDDILINDNYYKGE